MLLKQEQPVVGDSVSPGTTLGADIAAATASYPVQDEAIKTEPTQTPRKHHLRRHADHEKMGFENIKERVARTTHAGVKQKHVRALTVLGRIGWCAKAVIYSLIGGLCCRAAASSNFKAREGTDASPQGAFVLIGKGATGIYILIIMAVAIATYIIWRFWEGITAQGSHPIHSAGKNFFSFRLSPLVSGGVYTAYLVYILTLIPKAFDYKNDAVGNTRGNDFTKDWDRSTIGKIGLVVLGIAFLAGSVVQLLNVLTTKFHRELRLQELRPWIKWVVLVAGHIGFLGRAALFMMIVVLLFRSVSGNGGEKNKNTFGNALNTLTHSKGGRAVLFLIGFALIVYGLFAVLNSYPARVFPTPLPTEAEQKEILRKRAVKDQLMAEGRLSRWDTYRDMLADLLPFLPIKKSLLATMKMEDLASFHEEDDAKVQKLSEVV